MTIRTKIGYLKRAVMDGLLRSFPLAGNPISRVLLATWNESAGSDVKGCIVVGSCCEVLRGPHPAKLSPVVLNPLAAKPCDTFNGNCVLMGSAACRAVGMMRQFKHAMSDTDYGLRARRAGVRLIVAPGYVAECRSHSEQESWECRSLPRRERWRLILSRKGLPPGDWWRFLWAHARLRAFLYWPVPYGRVIAGL